MENEVKVKSYNFELCNLGYFFGLIFIVVGILMLSLSKSRVVFLWAVCCFFPLAFLVLLPSIVFRFYCNTYDIFDESGITRVHKGIVVCQTTWENVKKISYKESLFWIPVLVFQTAVSLFMECIHVLKIEFIIPISYRDSNEPKRQSHLFRSDNKNMMFTHISRKKLKMILPFIPNNIEKNIPKKYVMTKDV